VFYFYVLWLFNYNLCHLTKFSIQTAYLASGYLQQPHGSLMSI